MQTHAQGDGILWINGVDAKERLIRLDDMQTVDIYNSFMYNNPRRQIFKEMIVCSPMGIVC